MQITLHTGNWSQKPFPITLLKLIPTKTFKSVSAIKKWRLVPKSFMSACNLGAPCGRSSLLTIQNLCLHWFVLGVCLQWSEERQEPPLHKTPTFRAPQKKFMCLISWERTQNGTHINFSRGFWGNKRAAPSKRGLGPVRGPKKGHFGAVSALLLWLGGASNFDCNTSPISAPICIAVLSVPLNPGENFSTPPICIPVRLSFVSQHFCRYWWLGSPEYPQISNSLLAVNFAWTFLRLQLGNSVTLWHDISTKWTSEVPENYFRNSGWTWDPRNDSNLRERRTFLRIYAGNS